MRDIHNNYIKLIYGEKSFEEAKPEFIEKFKPGLTKLNLMLEGKDYFAG